MLPEYIERIRCSIDVLWMFLHTRDEWEVIIPTIIMVLTGGAEC